MYHALRRSVFEQTTQKQLVQEVQELSKELFYALAVAIKLNFVVSGRVVAWGKCTHEPLSLCPCPCPVSLVPLLLSLDRCPLSFVPLTTPEFFVPLSLSLSHAPQTSYFAFCSSSTDLFLDINSLYEQAKKENIEHRRWNAWLNKQVDKALK